LSIDRVWQLSLGIAVWVIVLGFIASVIWNVYHESDHASDGEVAKREPWTTFQAWTLGLGIAFIVLLTLSRFSGSSDTDFLTSFIWLIGALAVFGWLLSAMGAVALMVWRLTLFIKARRASLPRRN
jgi:hypothetical protein